MKVSQVIDIFDEERPNQIKVDTKLRWLKEIEKKILNNVVLSHKAPLDEEGNERDFSNYFDGWGMAFELYIPEEYIDVYKYFLDTKACKVEDDINQLNIVSALFNASYLEYVQFYNRTNLPKQVSPVFLDHTRL